MGPLGRKPGLWLVVLGTLVLGAVALPLFAFQRAQSARTRCLSNERRLATALLLYAQDHDGRLPRPETAAPGGGWRTWVSVLEPYITARQDIDTCPVNAAGDTRDPYRGYPYPYSYALNIRFFGVFAPGPYPVENLELPAQTALLVESGPIAAAESPMALSWYWDTAWWPAAYPSPHGRKMNVVAADGHTATVEVAHYAAAGHDALYGRLGGTIYNWNGGHPNGDTSGPPRE